MNFDPLKFSEGLRKILDREQGYLLRRIEALETEVRTLKSGSHLKYRGTFKTGVLYVPGDAITDKSAFWVCLSVTDSRPPGENWQLAAKGRDPR